MKVNFSAFPEGGSSENSFGEFYHNCGVGMCIIGFIAGIILAIELKSFWVFLGVCLADFLASIGYFAISRIFEMLEKIMTQEYVGKIELPNVASKSASAENTSVSADMVTNAFTQVEETENKDAYHFQTRFTTDFECPKCKNIQAYNRNCCWKCGSLFIYDDEEEKIKDYHFPKRFTEDFECPNCGNVIPSFMNVCKQCNTRFYFDN